MNLFLKILFGIYMVLIILGAFLYAPTVKDLGETTKIFYFHVPCAWIATLAFFVSAVYSIQYLQKQDILFDLKASSAAQIGLIFTLLATVTGAIWAHVQWGKAWNWDPRQISIFVLLLIYGAYFALRSAIEETNQSARLSSVYSIIAFIPVVFFMFIMPRLLPGLHPGSADDQGSGPVFEMEMEPEIALVFFGSLLGFTVLFFWMLYLHIQTTRLTKIKLKAKSGD